MVNFNSGSLVCERYILGPLEVNTYLVYEKGSSEGILIDPAEDSQTILKRLKELDFKTLTIFITHGHADHIQGVEFFRKHFPVSKVAISEEDAAMLPVRPLIYLYLSVMRSKWAAPTFSSKMATLLKPVPTREPFHTLPVTPRAVALIFDGMVFRATLCLPVQSGAPIFRAVTANN